MLSGKLSADKAFMVVYMLLGYRARGGRGKQSVRDGVRSKLDRDLSLLIYIYS